MNIRKDQTLTLKATGAKVRVIGVDSNPACDVWVCVVADPDRGMFVPRSALAE